MRNILKKFATGLVIGLLINGMAGATEWTKTDYILAHCQGESEYRIAGGSKVDCVTDTHAIKYAFASEWATAIGEALHWAAMTGKRPGIVVIIDPKSQYRHLARLQSALDSIPCIEIEVSIISTGI